MMRHGSGSFVQRYDIKSPTLIQLALKLCLQHVCVCAYLVGEGGWDPCGRAPPASEERLEGPAVGNKGFMEAELPACTARVMPISQSAALLHTHMQLLLATSTLDTANKGLNSWL